MIEKKEETFSEKYLDTLFTASNLLLCWLQDYFVIRYESGSVGH